MKLGKLNAAIDAAPIVYGMTTMGPIALQKGSLKAALRAFYTEGKGQETGRKLDAKGVIVLEDDAW
jgi:hypothetical protein